MKRLFIVLIAVSIIAGCNKTETGPQGPAGEKGETGAPGNTAKGSISGRIKQYDMTSKEYTTSLNTTTVSISNTSLSTITDVDGNYKITNVPTGTYEIHLRKPNCGLVRIQQVAFPGNGNLVRHGSITDKPDYEFTGGYLKDTMIANSKYINYNVTFSVMPNTGYRYLALLLSDSPDIDPENPRTYLISVILAPSISPAQNGVKLSNINQIQQIFKSGATVYANIYPCSQAGTYQDLEAVVMPKWVNPTCRTALGPSISFVFP